MNGAGPPSARLPGGTLALALEILEQIAQDRQGMSAAEIARLVGAPRATVYRVVNSLVRDEYLVRRADFSGFMLGARVLELAAVVDNHRSASHLDILRDVRAQTGQAIHLLSFHDAGVDVVHEDAQEPLSNRAQLLADPTVSAAGHLWIAHSSQNRRSNDAAPRWRVRPSPDHAAAITAAVSARGYAEQAGLLSAGRACLAVPVGASAGEPLGALTLATSLSGLSLAARHIGALREAAVLLAGTDVLHGQRLASRRG